MHCTDKTDDNDVEIKSIAIGEFEVLENYKAVGLLAIIIVKTCRYFWLISK